MKRFESMPRRRRGVRVAVYTTIFLGLLLPGIAFAAYGGKVTYKDNSGKTWTWVQKPTPMQTPAKNPSAVWYHAGWAYTYRIDSSVPAALVQPIKNEMAKLTGTGSSYTPSFRAFLPYFNFTTASSANLTFRYGNYGNVALALTNNQHTVISLQKDNTPMSWGTYRICEVANRTTSCYYIGSLIAHEYGHVLGLDHSAASSGPGGRYTIMQIGDPKSTVFGDCDTAALQGKYGIYPGKSFASSCLPFTFSLSGPGVARLGSDVVVVARLNLGSVGPTTYYQLTSGGTYTTASWPWVGSALTGELSPGTVKIYGVDSWGYDHLLGTAISNHDDTWVYVIPYFGTYSTYYATFAGASNFTSARITIAPI